MRRLSNRAWILLMLAICLAVTASAAGLVLSRHGAQAAAAPAPAPSGLQPGSAQTRADLGHMQVLLNSGSSSKQAAILPPSVAFVPGSGPVFPPGTTITIRQGTFRSTGGPTGTVQAVLSDKTAVTLELHSAKGHWYLYNVKAGAQTSAKITSRSAGPVTAQLLSKIIPGDVLPPNQVPTQGQIGQKTPVIFVHGFGESAGNWSDGPNGKDMLSGVDTINGVMSLRFDYSGVTAEKWVDNPANGPALATYIKKVAQASTDGKGNGKVVIVAFSMGGLLTRYAATTGGAGGDIGMVITIGTPNAGSFAGDGRTLLCYNGVVLPAIADQFLPGICTQWDAASAMGVFSPQIWLLPKLPSSIPVVHALAGDETLVWTIWSKGTWSAKAELPLHGDGVVPTWSALEKRSGGQENTGFTRSPCTSAPGARSPGLLLLLTEADRLAGAPAAGPGGLVAAGRVGCVREEEAAGLADDGVRHCGEYDGERLDLLQFLIAGPAGDDLRQPSPGAAGRR